MKANRLTRYHKQPSLRWKEINNKILCGLDEARALFGYVTLNGKELRLVRPIMAHIQPDDFKTAGLDAPESLISYLLTKFSAEPEETALET